MLEVIDTVLQAVLPSLCVSVVMVYFNKAQKSKDEQTVENEKLKEESTSVQLSLMLAAAKLSYATAMAMKNGHPNGEVEEGVAQYKKAMQAFKKLERDLVTKSTMND